MRTLSFDEFCDVCGVDVFRLNVLRRRDQAVGAFGRDAHYRPLAFLALDVVATRLADVLAEKLPRNTAANIVRDAWPVWTLVVAAAEATAEPVFLYIIEAENLRGERTHIATGSTLDSRSDHSLREIADDIRRNTGLLPKSYVVVEMQSVLTDVRRAAKLAKVDIGDAFLPPYGSPELAELLHGGDGGAVVIAKKASERAKRAGLAARDLIEKRESRE